MATVSQISLLLGDTEAHFKFIILYLTYQICPQSIYNYLLSFSSLRKADIYNRFYTQQIRQDIFIV